MSTEVPPKRLAIIGIGGKPGSDTESLALSLARHIGPEKCSIVAADAHYRSQQLDALLLRLRALRDQQAGQVIFLEGVVTLALSPLRELCDVTVFLDVPETIRHDRVASEESTAPPEGAPPPSVNPIAICFEDISAQLADITVDGASLSSLDVKMIWGAILAALSASDR